MKSILLIVLIKGLCASSLALFIYFLNTSSRSPCLCLTTTVKSFVYCLLELIFICFKKSSFKVNFSPYVRSNLYRNRENPSHSSKFWPCMSNLPTTQKKKEKKKKKKKGLFDLYALVWVSSGIFKEY